MPARVYVADLMDARRHRHREDFGTDRQEAGRRLAKVVGERNLELDARAVIALLSLLAREAGSNPAAL